MSSASESILEKRESPTWRVMYRLELRDAQGQPVSGEVACEITGDGSFVSGMSSKEIKRETDESGIAHMIWYRRSVFDRDVKANVTATAPEGMTVTLTRLSEEEAAKAYGLRTGFTPRDIYRA